MTPEQLQTIKAANEARTPGKWNIEYGGDGSEHNTEKWPQVLHGPKSTMQWNTKQFQEDYGDEVSEVDELSDADAEFIALSSWAIPALLEHIEELEKQLRESQQMHVGAIERSHRWMNHVMTNAANGNWAQLMEDVGDDLNNVDAVDDESIELWERGKAKADEAMQLPGKLAELILTGNNMGVWCSSTELRDEWIAAIKDVEK